MGACGIYIVRTNFLIQKRVRKYLTKHFPRCYLLILYLLRVSPSARFAPCIQQKKRRVMFLFRLSASTLSLFRKPSVNVFRTKCLPCHQSTLQLGLICFLCLAFFQSFASRFQTFPCLIKLYVVDNAYGIVSFFKTFRAFSVRGIR